MEHNGNQIQQCCALGIHEVYVSTIVPSYLPCKIGVLWVRSRYAAQGRTIYYTGKPLWSQTVSANTGLHEKVGTNLLHKPSNHEHKALVDGKKVKVGQDCSECTFKCHLVNTEAMRGSQDHKFTVMCDVHCSDKQIHMLKPINTQSLPTLCKTEARVIITPLL